MIKFKIVTLNKSPKLLKTFVAPRICGHKPFKFFKIIDSDGVRHTTFCVNNLAFLLNFKFHSVKKSYNDFLFEAIVSINTDIVFHDVSRNLYYCKLKKLPHFLQEFFKCLSPTSDCKDSVRYFYTWLNEKILPKFENPVTKETDKMNPDLKNQPSQDTETADKLRQKVVQYAVYLDVANRLDGDGRYTPEFTQEIRHLLNIEFDKAVRNYADALNF